MHVKNNILTYSELCSEIMPFVKYTCDVDYILEDTASTAHLLILMVSC
jgi:hypothetical protein